MDPVPLGSHTRIPHLDPVPRTAARAGAGARREVRVDAIDVEGEMEGAATVWVDSEQRHLDHLCYPMLVHLEGGMGGEWGTGPRRTNWLSHACPPGRGHGW